MRALITSPSLLAACMRACMHFCMTVCAQMGAGKGKNAFPVRGTAVGWAVREVTDGFSSSVQQVRAGTKLVECVCYRALRQAGTDASLWKILEQRGELGYRIVGAYYVRIVSAYYVMRRRRVAAFAILQLWPIVIRQLHFVPLHLTGLGLNCLLELQYLKPSFIYIY